MIEFNRKIVQALEGLGAVVFGELSAANQNKQGVRNFKRPQGRNLDRRPIRYRIQHRLRVRINQ